MIKKYSYFTLTLILITTLLLLYNNIILKRRCQIVINTNSELKSSMKFLINSPCFDIDTLIFINENRDNFYNKTKSVLIIPEGTCIECLNKELDAAMELNPSYIACFYSELRSVEHLARRMKSLDVCLLKDNDYVLDNKLYIGVINRNSISNVLRVDKCSKLLLKDLYQGNH